MSTFISLWRDAWGYIGGASAAVVVAVVLLAATKEARCRRERRRQFEAKLRAQFAELDADLERALGGDSNG